MTLTELSFYSRKALPYVGVIFLLLLILVLFVRLIFLAFEKPTSLLMYTNPIFGKIGKPVVKNASSSAGLTFRLDTIEGQPTTATLAGNVYFIPPTSARFGYREKIYLMAKSFGFDTEIIKHKLIDKEATFKEDVQSLTIDVTNFNFRYEYEFSKNPELFKENIIPNIKEIEDKASNFLNSIGRYPEQLSQGKRNLIYLFYNTSSRSITVLDSPIGANMVEVDFYRPDIEQIPSVSSTYFNSQNYVMLVFKKDIYKVVKAQINFFDISDGQIGIYPYKSGDKAWEDLRNGRAIIVSNPSGIRNIVIKKMFLGYMDSETYQEYFQPVYVFLGLNNFIAYVPAVSDEYLIE